MTYRGQENLRQTQNILTLMSHALQHSIPFTSRANCSNVLYNCFIISFFIDIRIKVKHMYIGCKPINNFLLTSKSFGKYFGIAHQKVPLL